MSWDQWKGSPDNMVTDRDYSVNFRERSRENENLIDLLEIMTFNPTTAI